MAETRGSTRCCSRSLSDAWERRGGRGIVQEAYLRYHRVLLEQNAEIESPKAYLSAVTTRLAHRPLRSARVRKETYIGEWLPSRCSRMRLLRRREVRRGSRLALDGVPAAARAALAGRAGGVPASRRLRHGYDEVAGIIGKSEDNCRSSRRDATCRRANPASKRREERERLSARFSTPSRAATWTD